MRQCTTSPLQKILLRQPKKKIDTTNEKDTSTIELDKKNLVSLLGLKMDAFSGEKKYTICGIRNTVSTWEDSYWSSFLPFFSGFFLHNKQRSRLNV